MHGRVATFFGTILRETGDARMLIDVEPRMGDAEELKLGGQIWFAKRECREIHEMAHAGGHDIVRVPWHVAEAKALAAGNVRKRKRRK
jgi:hypothetical protein